MQYTIYHTQEKYVHKKITPISQKMCYWCKKAEG